MTPIHQSLIRCVLFLFSLQLAPTLNATQTDDVLSHEQARTLMHAVGQVYLREQMTFNLLADCAGEYKHLTESAERAKKSWLHKNSATVKKSTQIQDYVSQSIQAQQSNFGAVKFTLDIETLIHNSVTSFRSELANKSRKDRHYLCNRLILSISAGEWDLTRQVPDAISIISKFKK